MKYLAALLVLTACATPKTIHDAIKPSDDQMLSVCWPESGMVNFGETCDDMHPVEWGKLPLKIKSMGLVESTLEAVDVWNTSMGSKVINYTTNPYAADIGVIFVDRGPEYHTNGEIDYIKTQEGEILCLITMYKDRVDTLVHEIGHCLGLAHDPDDNRSIMFPYSTGRVVPRIQPDDVATLKARYDL